MGRWEDSLALRVQVQRMLFPLEVCGLSLASYSLCILWRMPQVLFSSADDYTPAYKK